MLYFTLLQLQDQIKLISQSGLIHVLVWLIVIDIATGITKSFKEKETNSTTGLFGVVKHALVITKSDKTNESSKTRFGIEKTK